MKRIILGKYTKLEFNESSYDRKVMIELSCILRAFGRLLNVNSIRSRMVSVFYALDARIYACIGSIPFSKICSSNKTAECNYLHEIESLDVLFSFKLIICLHTALFQILCFLMRNFLWMSTLRVRMWQFLFYFNEMTTWNGNISHVKVFWITYH